jgi:hypothetical protein
MLNPAYARLPGMSALLVAIDLLLTACNNTYGPPPRGTPENSGQQHYLDVERAREQNQNRTDMPSE